MTARLATKYSKLVLQGQDVELLCVQKAGSTFVLFDFLIMHLQANDCRVVVVTVVIGHRHDGGVRSRAGGGDGLLQIGGKRRDSAATRERIAKERHAAKSCQ